MKTITLRGIDDVMESALREKSEELSIKSLNSTILFVLQEALGLTKRKHGTVYRDLDHLAGTWNEADLKEFEEAIAVFEQVDEELWR